MPPGQRNALVVSSAHWPGDPRLNRHVRYLERAGIPTVLVAHGGATGRLTSSLRAFRTIWRSKQSIVILVDPEMFVLGSLVVRAHGSRAVIDIHEDYAAAGVSRAWVPKWLRPVVRTLATLNDRVARWIANCTIVAAQELAPPRGHVVPNIPDPSEFEVRFPGEGAPQIVYIGDVTVARGALEMAQLAARLPEARVVVIGRVSDELRERMADLAGTGARLEITGRLSHEVAWSRARGSIAGLSWLNPFPAYQQAVATKLWEYCAAGIPPIVSDLPGQRRFVSRLDSSLAFADLDGAVAVVRRLIADREWQQSLAQLARQTAITAWEEQRPDKALYEAVVP